MLLAESGPRALEVLALEKPDVIVLDRNDAGMDGATMLFHLRQQPSLANTPIVFMTAKVQKHEIDSYCLSGAAGVISKPFDPVTLPEEIERILTVQYEHAF